MTDLRHAGIHWPENAGGEHPNRDYILGVTGSAGGLLMCSPSARYHYGYARQYDPSRPVMWRAVPREGRRPAELKWDATQVAEECLNLWDDEGATAGHFGVEYFTPLNELQFDKELGGGFPGYATVAQHLGQLRQVLRDRLPGVKLFFPPWVPSDDGSRAREWVDEALEWDGVVLHAYGDAAAIIARIQAYRDLLGPTTDLWLGEWNDEHQGHDVIPTLQALADYAVADPALVACTYYIWETANPGEQDFSIWGRPDRLAAFDDPPVAQVGTPGHEAEHGDAPVDDGTPTHEEPAPPAVPDPSPPAVDPWAFFTAEQVAAATGAPLVNVQDTWPRQVAQLELAGINRRSIQEYVVGTIAVETGGPDPSVKFTPVREAYWISEEQRAADPTISRYYPWYGRGTIQLTWEDAYVEYTRKLEELWGPGSPDLHADPDAALDGDVAAAVTAMFFRDRRALPSPSYPEGYTLQQASDASDTEWVRRLVQGGTAGLDTLTAVVNSLQGAPSTDPGDPTPDPQEQPVVKYDPTYPAIAQDDPWSCSLTALRWAMEAWGRRPAEGWVEAQAKADGVATEGDGLLDGTGHRLAAWITDQWGEFDYSAEADYPVTFDQVAREVTPKDHPVLIGGMAWNHWSGCRGYDPARDVLLLANPANSWRGVYQEMTRPQFDDLGPFAMVSITNSTAGAPAVEGEDPAMIAELQHRVAGLEAQVSALENLVGNAYNADSDVFKAIGRIVSGRGRDGRVLTKAQMQAEARGVEGFLEANRPHG